MLEMYTFNISQIFIFLGTIYCLHCHGEVLLWRKVFIVCVKVRSPSLGLIINLLLFQWVGTECGHHSTYTFYKAVKFANKFATSEEAETLTPQKSSSQSAKETWKVLSLGQFFFVKIWAGSDLLSVAELQLLWEDKVLYCTVLYCTVLYCIVLWQGDRSDDEQRAPLPPARVHRRGEAAAPRRGESRRAGVVYHYVVI